MSIRKEIRQAKKARDKALNEAPKRAILENSELIIQMLQKQLRRGELGDGPAPQYGLYTEDHFAKPERELTGVPARFKRPSQRYNFEWSGDFFDSMHIQIKGRRFVITAPYSTLNPLRTNPKLAGRAIMKLTEGRERKVVKEIIGPEMYEEFLRGLGNIF